MSADVIYVDRLGKHFCEVRDISNGKVWLRGWRASDPARKEAQFYFYLTEAIWNSPTCGWKPVDPRDVRRAAQ